MTHATARHASIAEINITPLIDVMLVLTIIFLMAATVVGRVDLDIGRSDLESKDSVLQHVVVQADGSVRWEGTLIPADAVAEQMRFVARSNPRTILEIAATADARYEPVAAVFAEARAAGLENLGVAMDPR